MVDEVKENVYLIDTGKANLSDSTAISGYTKINSGNEFLVIAYNVKMVVGKTVNPIISIGMKDSVGLYKEGGAQHNSAANRSFVVSGVLDKKKADGKTLFADLCRVARSPAIFGMSCELSQYADNPNGTYTASSLSTNIVAGKYYFVVFNEFNCETDAGDQNIVNFVLSGVLTND
jgi:hypothetical protein